MSYRWFRRRLTSTGVALMGAVATAFWVGPAWSADSTTLVSHANLWLMKRVGSPVTSPDGRWVVFSVTEPSYDKSQTRSDLWLLSTDGQTPARQITHTRAAENGVVFSPDSQRILFTTKRDGDSAEQAYVLSITGSGEAVKITDSTLGVHAARFTPDGQSIAYVTDFWPGANSEAENAKLDKERSEQKAKVRSYEHYPVRYWDHWLDERKPHLMIQSISANSVAKDLFKGTKLISMPGFQGRLEDDGSHLDYVFSGDGKTIVFAASTDADQAARSFTSTPLWSVPLEGGEPTRLTTESDQYSNLKLSADGQYLYAQRNLASAHVYTNSHVVRFKLAISNGQVTLSSAEDLMAGLDRSASGYSIAHDGSIAFSAEEAGLDVIYLAAPGKGTKKLFDQKRGVYSSVNFLGSFDKPSIIARYETATDPAEIVAVDQSGINKPLTSFAADEAHKLAWTPLEPFVFKDSHGHLIHNWLVKPEHFDPSKKYPLIVLMHGGPASMWKDQISLRWNYHLIAGTQYVLVLTDYKGSTGYGEAFANAIEKDPLKGPADEINQGADEAIKRFPFIDGSRQCAAGASYGGHLSNWMQASTHRYKCLVSHAGLVDLTEQWGTSDSNYHREVMVGGPPWSGLPLWQTQSPLHYAKDFKTPVLVTVGERDFRVPLPNTLTYWAALQRQGVESRLLVFPDENHWILNAENSKRYYQELQQWFDRYLKP
jgi:dipeptidyl aminopeptidase/acylaminoacyl peptidase